MRLLDKNNKTSYCLYILVFCSFILSLSWFGCSSALAELKDDEVPAAESVPAAEKVPAPEAPIVDNKDIKATDAVAGKVDDVSVMVAQVYGEIPRPAKSEDHAAKPDATIAAPAGMRTEIPDAAIEAGAEMSPEQMLVRQLRGQQTRIIWSGVEEGKRVALTFDDGPTPEYTARILRILDRFDVSGTFFMLGNHVSRHPELVMEVHASGHTLGNHTFNHARLSKIESWEAKQEINRTQEEIYKACGAKPIFLRPPWGSYNENTLAMCANLDMIVVLWSVDSRDWSVQNPDAILAELKTQIRPGSIILFHETKPQTVSVLPPLLHWLNQEGYNVVPLADLL